jgi:hypothetical protein
VTDGFVSLFGLQGDDDDFDMMGDDDDNGDGDDGDDDEEDDEGPPKNSAKAKVLLVHCDFCYVVTIVNLHWL